jgi:hypothetical protein
MASRNGVTNALMSTKQVLAATGSTQKFTNAVGAYTNLVYVFNHAATTAFVLFGQTGDTVATTTGFPIAAATGHYLKIGPGQYVHCLLASSTGNVDLIEMTH